MLLETICENRSDNTGFHKKNLKALLSKSRISRLPMLTSSGQNKRNKIIVQKIIFLVWYSMNNKHKSFKWLDMLGTIAKHCLKCISSYAVDFSQ